MAGSRLVDASRLNVPPSVLGQRIGVEGRTVNGQEQSGLIRIDGESDARVLNVTRCRLSYSPARVQVTRSNNRSRRMQEQ